MLSMVEVYNDQNVLQHQFPINFPAGGSYFIKSIDGLGPVKAAVTSSVFGSQDGEAFQSAKVGKRNIVINMGMRPDYSSNQTYQDLREALYYSMPPKANIKLRFIDSIKPTVEIWGYVETNEPTIFVSEPAVQLSIINTLPNFLAIAPTVINAFANDDIVLNYLGTAPVGFLAEFDATATLQFVQVVNYLGSSITQNESFVWNGGPHLVSGQKIFLSTQQGNKFITIQNADGTTLNGLYGLTNGTLTMQIDRKFGKMVLRTAFIGTAHPVPVKLTYTTAYIGI